MTKFRLTPRDIDLTWPILGLLFGLIAGSLITAGVIQYRNSHQEMHFTIHGKNPKDDSIVDLDCVPTVWPR
jgi:hypothetical protein